MAEQYVNNAVTTLAADITDSATTLILSDASAFPATGNFRLRVGDELLLCSARAGVSCTVSRGEEGTTAAAHTAGTEVSHPLTAEALGIIIEEAIAADAGTGDVVGPASSTDDRIATFDGVTGKLLQDGGQTIAEVIAAASSGAGDVVGPASSVASEIALFDGTTGKLLKRATGTGWAKVASGVLSAAAITRTVGITIDGGGAAITTGVKGYVVVPFSGTIAKATLLADQSGSIVIDVWKDTYANFPPVDADSITASAPPTLSGATKSQDATLTGWTTSITAGDVVGFNVDSASTVTRVTLVLEVTT